MKRRRKKHRASRTSKALQTLRKVEDRVSGGKIHAGNVILVIRHPEVKRAQSRFNRSL